ncbi:MAG: hypothetical protein SFU85_13695 [Candidatus Methylacidiphilales bacterium]|nr:hypothetical protein [Candidatus Methylacidiphilales bacterium]
MPFPASWIKERLVQSRDAGRLAHAYLLTGSSMDDLERLFRELAGALLNSSASEQREHEDLHVIRPESKSRRLGIDQVRSLEKELRLKSYRGGLKVAGIVAADQLCQGRAEAANAFLKTLEEPPDHSVLFLLSDRPEQLLPTIRSRCLTLPLQKEGQEAPTAILPPDWLEAWHQAGHDSADAAYRRASLLQELFRALREAAESKFSDHPDGSKEEKDALAALIESEFIPLRDRALSEIISSTWSVTPREFALFHGGRICLALDDLRYALSRNIDQSLAIDRACLKISGLI